jgi:hypothetical protein
MSESRSTLHGFSKALEKWKSFTPLREEGSSNNRSKIKQDKYNFKGISTTKSSSPTPLYKPQRGGIYRQTPKMPFTSPRDNIYKPQKCHLQAQGMTFTSFQELSFTIFQKLSFTSFQKLSFTSFQKLTFGLL